MSRTDSGAGARARADTARIAIIGGGRACHELLTMLGKDDSARLGLTVVGVADPDPDSPGLALARAAGIELTVPDYHAFFQRDDIDLVVELTGRPEVREDVFRSLPAHVHFIDHYAARFFWNFFELAEERNRILRQAEERVKQERNRLQLILDSLPYEVLVIRPDYVVETANRKFLQTNELNLDQVAGRYCYDLEHRTKGPCDIAVGGGPHPETLRAGQVVSTVVSHRSERGEERFAAVAASPIIDEAGSVIGVVEATRDITERVRLESALKDTRERLNQFIDIAPLFIYMKDVNLRYLVINKRALELLGREEQQVVGQTDFALYPETTAREWQAREREVLHTRRPLHVRGVLPLPEREMHYSATLFPVLKDDRVIGLFGLIEDTTELHQSEVELVEQKAKLVETREFLQGVLENSRDMIFLTDTAGQILSLNTGARLVLGLEQPEEFLGHSILEFAAAPDGMGELLAAALRESHAEQFEIPFRRRDGETAICNVSLTLINDHQGQPLEVLGICRNVTTRVRLQEDLIRAERLAAIGKMAAGVAHEINNPLAVIETIAGLVRETLEEKGACLPEGTKANLLRAAERLLYQTRRCTTITHSLLGFARKSGASRQPVDLPALLGESLDFLAPEIKQLAVEVRREFAPDLPPVVTDPNLLQQVFVNLLKNALDAVEEKNAPGGELTIRAGRAGKGVAVAIRDNGVGIPAGERDKIFDLFHTSKSAGKGTGLGLSIVFNILKKLGGEIEVASEPGAWTEVTVRLPLGEEPA